MQFCEAGIVLATVEQEKICITNTVRVMVGGWMERRKRTCSTSSGHQPETVGTAPFITSVGGLKAPRLLPVIHTITCVVS